MNPSRPIVLWALVIGAASLAAVGGSFAAMTDARDAAARSARELADCDRLAADIHAARGRPALAEAADARPEANLSAVLDGALGDADVRPADLTRVTPDAPRRVGDTDYEERPTRLALRRLSFAQAVRLLHALSADGRAGLSLDAVRLTAGRADGEADATPPTGAAAAAGAWTAEVTVSTLVYAPRKPQAPARPPAAAAAPRL